MSTFRELATGETVRKGDEYQDPHTGLWWPTHNAGRIVGTYGVGMKYRRAAAKAEPLPAFRVHLADGTDYVTNMAAGVTLAEARAYFVGQEQVREDFETGAETKTTVTEVTEA